jgi:uncharacterized protein (TIGR00299 family) protein
MRVAYVEMIGGAAGDMLMGAWVDAGLDVAALERALRTVVADGWELVTEKVVRRGIAATHLDLVIPGEDDHAHGPGEGDATHTHHGHRLRDIIAIVERSGLTLRQIERASAIYRRLADAEARVHGTSVEDVAFHEVGQIDAILDVAGTCIALDLLGIDEVYCSAFPMGHGLATMAHGTYPNPGPATLELLRGAPLRAVDVAAELVTTTGAAILSTLVRAPGQRVDLTLERIGYGAGRKDFPIPNVVRVTIGTQTGVRAVGSPPDRGDDVTVLECNIDDMSPQHYELALERLFAAGALDVWLTPIHMKKGRPAITLAAVAPPAAGDAVARAMLRETTTIGVRLRDERRIVLPRETVMLETPLGPIRAKRVEAGGIGRLQPEYDDVVRVARERDLPLAEVVRIVGTAAHETVPS